MGKKVTDQSTPPIAQPVSAQTAKISSELTNASNHAAQFVTEGRGKNCLGAGKPRAYSDSPPRSSNRVTDAAATAGLMLANKKTKKNIA